MKARLAAALLAVGLAVSTVAGLRGDEPARALGTLEWELVRLSAPVSERIVEVAVAEGDDVTEGQALVRLDDAVLAAQVAAAEAEALRARRRRDELAAGARPERVSAARARLARAQRLAEAARRDRERAADNAAQGLLARADLDRAVATAGAAEADVDLARAELAELEAGARPEELAQAEAALAAADAAARALRETRAQRVVRAPRAGRVESLPFERGDRPPAGSPVVTLLVGAAPYARVYAPARLRARLAPGTPFEVSVAGVSSRFAGRVRSVAREPSFTPYYALQGDDAARLVYVAEVALGPEAADLPAGLPVTAALAPGSGRE